MKKAKPKAKLPRPVRPLSAKWKRWTARNFIRLMDRLTRKDALEILGITRKMVPRRGHVQYDWSRDDEWRHP
jgi:hypothetical protein